MEIPFQPPSWTRGHTAEETGRASVFKAISQDGTSRADTHKKQPEHNSLYFCVFAYVESSEQGLASLSNVFFEVWVHQGVINEGVKLKLVLGVHKV